MVIHLIKMCVGIETPEIIHRTRMFPRRREELLDGGSLYWVVKKSICMRQRILDLRVVDDNGISKCDIVLDRTIVTTKRRPKRPFQGWRYLKPDSAPQDRYPLSADDDAGSVALKAELAALGLI